MNKQIIDDWLDPGMARRVHLEKSVPMTMDRSGSRRLQATARTFAKPSQGLYRSVFDAWRVLLLAALLLLPVIGFAGGNDVLMGQPLVEGCSAAATGALAGTPEGLSVNQTANVAIASTWEGGVRLLLSLMFVALIAFRLWRDE